MNVPFIDIHSQLLQIQKDVEAGLAGLTQRCDFILGQDVVDFENDFSDYLGVRYALGVNSGTDALFLGLKSLGIGPGDEVIVPDFTYIASAFAVTYAGAKPVFVDIDEMTYNMDARELEKLITKRTRAIMPVHLYGQSADMSPLLDLARRHKLSVIEDAAQAHGSEYQGQRVGSIGHIGAFSFYPTKNLGALGDAGLIATEDEGLYEKLKKLRDYGRKTRYEHESLGYNSRLDAIQAVYLKAKLKYLDEWNDRRVQIARQYDQMLADAPGVLLPQSAAYGKHIYHIYAVRVKNRDFVFDGLKKAGVQAAVHYPLPLHLQPVYRELGYRQGDFPVAERVCEEILCLPIFPHMKKNQVEYVVSNLKGLVCHD